MSTDTSSASPLDLAAERERCWRRLVDMVAFYQAGYIDGVVKLLREIEAEKGREIALRQKTEVTRLADCESWQNCDEWRNTNYRPSKSGKYGTRR